MHVFILLLYNCSFVWFYSHEKASKKLCVATSFISFLKLLEFFLTRIGQILDL